MRGFLNVCDVYIGRQEIICLIFIGPVPCHEDERNVIPGGLTRNPLQVSLHIVQCRFFVAQYSDNYIPVNPALLRFECRSYIARVHGRKVQRQSRVFVPTDADRQHVQLPLRRTGLGQPIPNQL